MFLYSLWEFSGGWYFTFPVPVRSGLSCVDNLFFFFELPSEEISLDSFWWTNFSIIGMVPVKGRFLLSCWWIPFTNALIRLMRRSQTWLFLTVNILLEFFHYVWQDFLHKCLLLFLSRRRRFLFSSNVIKLILSFYFSWTVVIELINFLLTFPDGGKNFFMIHFFSLNWKFLIRMNSLCGISLLLLHQHLLFSVQRQSIIWMMTFWNNLFMRNFLDRKTYFCRNKLIIQIEANCLFHLFLFSFFRKFFLELL